MRFRNGLLLTLLAGAMIYSLQVPLAGNAAPDVRMQMSVAIVLIAGIAFWVTKSMPTRKAAAIYIFMASAMILNARLRVRDYQDTSIDLFIMIQGLVFLSYLIMGSFLLFERPPKFKRPALIAVSILVFTAIASLINAPNFGYSAFSTVALLATLVFALYCAVRLAPVDIAVAIVLAALPMVILSLIVYLNPGQLNTHLWTYDPFVQARLIGIFNNPVALALASAMLILGTVTKAFFSGQRTRLWTIMAIVLVPIAIVCMVASISRGPAAGAIVALALGPLLAFRLFGRSTIPVFALVSALSLPLIYFAATEAFTADNLSFLARSGESREVATLTGRTTIWAMSFGIIAQKPFLGHGMGAPLVLLENIQIGTDFAVVEAHNLFLNTALMVGLPGALAVAWLLFFGIVRAYQKRSALALILLLFFAVSGITENFYFPNRPNWYSLIFYASLLSVAKASTPRIPQKVQKPSRRSGSTSGSGGSGGSGSSSGGGTSSRKVPRQRRPAAVNREPTRS